MNPSRIGIPINKKIDEWLFHFNGKSVKFDIHIKRRRDPESGETSHGIGLATFHAYFDRKHWTDQGMTMEQLGFPCTPISGSDYNDVFERAKKTVWAAKEQIWNKVIVMAVKGVSRMHDEDKVKFAWGVGLRSNDGTLFKTADSRNYVSRRVSELLPGGLSFEAEEIKVYPYTEEMEASMKELDAMFAKFTGALKFVISNPELLLGIKSRLLPLTVEEQPATPVKEQLTVNGIKL